MVARRVRVRAFITSLPSRGHGYEDYERSRRDGLDNGTEGRAALVADPGRFSTIAPGHRVTVQVVLKPLVENSESSFASSVIVPPARYLDMRPRAK